MPSRVPALLDYLVTVLGAAGAAASPPFTVMDGPVVTADPLQLVLWVGLTDPDSEGADTAGTFTQARSDLGQQTREEASSISCAAEAWSGTDDLGTVRRQAFAIVAAVETALRTAVDQTFGGLGQLEPGVTGGELLQNTTEAGALARVRFQIQFRSLNT